MSDHKRKNSLDERRKLRERIERKIMENGGEKGQGRDVGNEVVEEDVVENDGWREGQSYEIAEWEEEHPRELYMDRVSAGPVPFTDSHHALTSTSNQKSRILELENHLKQEIHFKDQLIAENIALREKLQSDNYVKVSEQIKVTKEINLPPDVEKLKKKIANLEYQLKELREINEEAQSNLELAVSGIQQAKEIENKLRKSEEECKRLSTENKRLAEEINTLESNLRKAFKETLDNLRSTYEDSISKLERALADKEHQLKLAATSQLNSSRQSVASVTGMQTAPQGRGLRESEFFSSKDLIDENAQLKQQLQETLEQLSIAQVSFAKAQQSERAKQEVKEEVREQPQRVYVQVEGLEAYTLQLEELLGRMIVEIRSSLNKSSPLLSTAPQPQLSLHPFPSVLILSHEVTSIISTLSSTLHLLTGNMAASSVAVGEMARQIKEMREEIDGLNPKAQLAEYLQSRMIRTEAERECAHLAIGMVQPVLGEELARLVNFWMGSRVAEKVGGESGKNQLSSAALEAEIDAVVKKRLIANSHSQTAVSTTRLAAASALANSNKVKAPGIMTSSGMHQPADSKWSNAYHVSEDRSEYSEEQSGRRNYPLNDSAFKSAKEDLTGQAYSITAQNPQVTVPSSVRSSGMHMPAKTQSTQNIDKYSGSTAIGLLSGGRSNIGKSRTNTDQIIQDHSASFSLLKTRLSDMKAKLNQ